MTRPASRSAAHGVRGRRDPEHQRTIPPAAHRRTPHPLRPGRTPRPHPGIRAPRVHRGRARRAHHHQEKKGCLMPNNKGRRRRFGALRKLPSGQWQARYKGPDGIMYAADQHLPDPDRRRGLAQSVKEAEIVNGDWINPDGGKILLSKSTRPTGSRNARTCARRRSSSTATCSAATWHQRSATRPSPRSRKATSAAGARNCSTTALAKSLRPRPTGCSKPYSTPPLTTG